MINSGKVDRETRREQIAKAALDIVGRHGVQGLTTAAIAKEVGISEAALYRHFSNKEEILLETVGKIGEGLKEKMQQVLNSDATCIEKLKMNYILNLEHIESNIGIPRLIFSEQIHVSSEKLKEKLLNNINSHTARLETMIIRCQETGSIREDVDPTATAITILGMIQTLAMKWSLSGCSFGLAKAGLEVWKNYEKCIKRAQSDR